MRKPLVIGVGLAVFQQITGINAIIYYANEIFAAAGFATPADQAAATTWAIGAVNVVATFIAVVYVDRFGLTLVATIAVGLWSLASVMTGYFQQPELTAEALSPDGWLDTGDLGYFLDGQIIITGRAKDLIMKARAHWFQE